MIVRTYVVDNMKEALIRAKYELGKDAVIVNQREIKVGKWYNPFKKTKLEVTVVKEDEDLEVSASKLEKEVKRERSLTEELFGDNPDRVLERSDSEELIDVFEENIIKTNRIFTGLEKEAMEKLVGYYRLNSIDSKEELEDEEIINFLNHIYKDNCFDKKLPLARINKFVGPTGVGKTTTIAKIAAHEHIMNQKKVGLITMDTYRIGAVEQLKTYGNILGIQCEVVMEPAEMIEKIELLDDCDLILIDTLGTSQNNKEKLEDIDEYFQEIDEDINTYLTISMSTDSDIMLSILDKYKKLNYQGVILTKLDELISLKNLWKFIENNSQPVEYFCYGQDVPDDIKEASLKNIISYAEEII